MEAISEVKLKVGELTERGDFGRGIARISARDMKRLGVNEGDVIEIEGKRRTVGIAVRAYPADVGLDVIRMDGLMRRNCGASISEVVNVKRCDAKEAKSVTIAPARKGIIIHMSPDLMKRNLLMRPVNVGDVIVPNPVVRTRQNTPDDVFGDLVENVFASFGMSVGGIGFSGFGEEKFVVVSADPKGPVRITRVTEIELLPQATEVMEEKIPEVTYEDLGGLHEEIKLVREMIELPLKHPELFERLGIEPPKGVLLHGPPGCGKTLLAKAVANESGARFYVINGPELMSKFYGESEENLRKVFDQAEKTSPSIIFIDEIDSLAPKREEVRGEVEKRMVSQLLTLLDGLKSRGKIIVIGATNIPNSLDPALRRPGRLDREIEIGVPDKPGRKEILQIHTRSMPMTHWDDKLAAQILLERVGSFENETGNRISNIRSKIEDLESDKLRQEKMVKDLVAELKELEREARVAPITIAQRILTKITGKQSEVDELQSKIKSIADDIHKKSNNIKKLEADIVIISEIAKQAHEHKEPIEIIASKISEIRHLEDVRAFEDIRNIFTTKSLKELSEELRQIASSLLDAEIISRDYYADVDRKSVNLMLTNFAEITYGYVGADVTALCKEGAMHALRRIIPDMSTIKEDKPLPPEILKKLVITKDDFDHALKMVQPSGMREVMIEIPKVKWADVGGLATVKQSLIEAVEWPLKNPKVFERMGIRPPKGVLLYGPPGCGKTMLAKAVANESGANFIYVKASELLSMWVGESEKHVRDIFRRAKQVAPAIIFFDEIDALTPKRGMGGGQDSHVTERVVSQMLAEMSGLEEMKDVIVLAATNRPDILDTALLRPGRFDRHILVPTPDCGARFEVFKIHAGGMPVDGVSLEDLADKTDGYSGADIEAICREAALHALRRDIESNKVTKHDFDKALEDVKPSVSETMNKFYQAVLKRKTQDMPEEDIGYVQ